MRQDRFLDDVNRHGRTPWQGTRRVPTQEYFLLTIFQPVLQAEHIRAKP